MLWVARGPDAAYHKWVSKQCFFAPRRSDEAAARSTAANAISLALLAGGACCLLLETNAEQAVRLVAGGDVSSASVAVDYLRSGTTMHALHLQAAALSCSVLAAS